MNFNFAPTNAAFVKCVDCHTTLARLVGNLSGFLYRRRLDPRWTMEFVSAGGRDITGYEPHRFIANASIAFGDLIACSDWERVNERVRLAVLHRQRATVEYLIRTAHGAWLQVEDRFTPVVNAAGTALAIEGLIDRARGSHNPTTTEPSEESRLAALCNSSSFN